MDIRKNKYIIGISAYYHDSSACLFKNGELIFACEEEKFTGKKHDSSFPFNVIKYIFKTYKLNKKDIEVVCYYEDPKLKYKRLLDNFKTNWYKNFWHCLQNLIDFKIKMNGCKNNLKLISNKVFYSQHHQSHLYYSFYTSNFKKAIGLSIDGVGESDTIVFTNGQKTESLASYPHSLGLFYSAMTSFLGFKPNEGEYKVMGLAAFGNAEVYKDRVDNLISYKNGKLNCNMKVFCWDREEAMFNIKLCDLLELEPRDENLQITKEYEDLAASVQLKYEEILINIVNDLYLSSNQKNLYLSGGCAYNGLGNSKILKKTKIENLWIPVAPSDAGSSVGACLNYLHQNGRVNTITQNPFLGPIYLYNDILKGIGKLKYKQFTTEDKMLKSVANLLYEGKIIGWYQGHCEFGQRALGNRSILANAFIDGVKDKINKVIKGRESFRPLAPAVIMEKQSEYFDIKHYVPYMNKICKIKPKYKKLLKEVSNIDGTARIQSVNKNTLFHKLLIEFGNLSGHPILLNTSFNIKGNPMVLTPKNAVDSYLESEIDVLIIGNFIIYKNKI